MSKDGFSFVDPAEFAKGFKGAMEGFSRDAIAKVASEVLGDSFTWTGDLEADCTTARNGFSATVQRQENGTWWVNVRDGKDVAWDSADCIGRITGADLARAVAEWVIRAISTEQLVSGAKIAHKDGV